jgi:tetratricopeptide (TPR) repeat protein
MGRPSIAGPRRSTRRPPRRGRRQRRKLEAFAKICAAVQHAHQRGVIHRDLKPDNILVDAKDEPHVLDFGVACRADRGVEREAPGRVTATGELACTLAYASPEQVSGDQTRIDSRSDVYALGRILYELLTGRPPYPCDGAIAEVLEAITNREPAPMRRRSNGTNGDRRGDDGAPVSKDLEIITLSALAKDPQHRIQTAAALHDDVCCVLSGDVISARRDSVLYVLRKALRRHRVPLAAVAIAAIGLLAGGVAITASALSSARAASRAALEEARMHVEAERSQTIAAVLRGLVPAEGRTADFGSSSESHRAIMAMSARLESSLFCDDLEGAATTRMLLGGVCLDRGAPRMAEEQLRVAVRHLSLRATPEDEKLAAAMHGLAAVLLTRREFVEAEERALRALSLRTALLGRQHPATLESMALLARVQLARGRAADAEQTCSEAASSADGESGLARLAGASIVEVQAEIALAGGRCDEAKALAERAVKIWLRERGDFDPGLPRALAILARAEACSTPDAGVETGAGAGAASGAVLAAAARELASSDSGALTAQTLRMLLALKSDLLAPDDPDRLETLALLTPRLRSAGELAEASAVADEAIDLATRLYGHVDVRLADLFLERGYIRHIVDHPDDPTGAVDFRRRLAILRCLLPGVDDFYLAMYMRETADYVDDTGAVEESDALREEALELLRCRFGPQSRELAWSSAILGTKIWDRGDMPAAIALLEEGLAQLDAIEPETNYYAARVHGWLGRALIEVGRFEEGRWHLERGAAMRNGSVEQAPLRGAALAESAR